MAPGANDCNGAPIVYGDEFLYSLVASGTIEHEPVNSFAGILYMRCYSGCDPRGTSKDVFVRNTSEVREHIRYLNVAMKEEFMNKQIFLKKLKNAQVFLGLFKNVGDVVSAFDIKDEDVSDLFILFAWYEYESYDGSAFVLFEQGGKLYEVNGGHCSCNGLEGQWSPEETTAEAVLHRVKHGSLGCDRFYNQDTFGDLLRRTVEGW